MLHFPRWKLIAIVAACLAALVTALPNAFTKEQVASWPSWMPKRQVPLGLDLRGGAHLLLSMDVDELKKDMVDTLRGDVRQKLRESRIGVVGTGLAGGGVQVRIAKPEDMEKALAALRTLSQPLSIVVGSESQTLNVQQVGNESIRLSITEGGIRQRITDAIGAAIETVRRRVDPAGNTEATITRQGTDRILVQVPGVTNTAELKARLGQAARLTFHDVHPDIYSSSPRAPAGYTALPSKEDPGRFYLVRSEPVVRGDELADAQGTFDSRTNEPIISFRFNQSGARKFGKYTSENVGRPFAIVLDKQVLSAPVIREPILGGSGQISGSFTPESANNLAINLRSGALPATLTIVEERTVGPSLGADSIKSGLTAFVIGGLATIALTIFMYGTFGVFAVLGLMMNGIMLLAVMTLFGSTLTLPGIAGLVLTLGMAVDANVLIFERIREELKNGRTPVNAIDAGFDRAMVTIIDSQLTTFVAALIMFWLGSGPIRGFAVTLSIGIFTSVFTAVTVVRLLVALWLRSAHARSRRVDIPI
ncbi:MAG: protein translocase subunit SecD [Hyphomicrobiaceae bacterium]